MNEYNIDKKYESFKIPDRRQLQESGVSQSLPPLKTDNKMSQGDELFYVIDYGSSNMDGVGKFVLKSQKIAPPQKDEIRDLFHSMRDIARSNHPQYYNNNKFYDKRVQQANAKIFYKQGMFMKDFTDNYDETTQFSSYFPNYQMMSYEQLRTYFTWRTKVRKGNVTDTSLSYAFLYIYELLNNIGVDDPQDGLNQLMSFWKEFSVHNKTIDKYVLRWLKDYHIYYELPQSFQEFVEEHHLAKHYPKMADTDHTFELFCAISKYDIRSSAFFTDDNIKLITDCFYYVTNKLKQVFVANGIHFDESIFQPTKKMLIWQPFRDALFYQWIKQPDRRIVLSENEIYLCNQNNWATGTVIALEDGRLLIGYIMKQMEAVLRVATKYKHKLSANLGTVTHAVVVKLNEAGLSLDKIVSDAVMEFYSEATKTVVTVDHKELLRIRLEALATQEKLIVPEQNESYIPIPAPLNLSVTKLPMTNPQITPLQDMPAITEPPEEPSPIHSPVDASAPVPEPIDTSTERSNPWNSLMNAFSETELQALSVLISGEKNIKQFADSNSVMLEVLIDGINEKAMDFVGDNLLDDEFTIYEDYKDQVKEMVDRI